MLNNSSSNNSGTTTLTNEERNKNFMLEIYNGILLIELQNINFFDPNSKEAESLSFDYIIRKIDDEVAEARDFLIKEKGEFLKNLFDSIKTEDFSYYTGITTDNTTLPG